MLRKFHENEQGSEGLEKLLIIAVLVLPLLALLIYFRQTISEWVSNQWSQVADDAKNSLTTPTSPTGVTPDP
jgi:Flp pilus assembly pilin Flp